MDTRLSVSSSNVQQTVNFETLTIPDGSLKLGNNNFTESVGYGPVKTASKVFGLVYVIHLHNVLYVLELKCNLISLSKARKKEFKAIIDDVKREQRGVEWN